MEKFSLLPKNGPQIAEELTQFINQYPNFNECTIQTFTDKKLKKDKELDPLAKKLYPYDEAKCRKLNEQGAGIYFSVNSMKLGKRTKKDVTGINARIAEIDGMSKDNQMDMINALPLKPSMIVGSKVSFHLYRFSKDGTIENRAPICMNICNRIGGDKKVAKDIARVLRIPGYWHCKDPQDKFLVTLKYINPTLIYTEQEMLEAFPCTDTIGKGITITSVEPRGSYDPKKHGIRGALAMLNNKEMLSKISGTPLVDNEKIEFVPNTNGTEQIWCNGTSTSCRIDKSGMIGGGPQTWIGRCLYYSKKKGLTDQNAKRIFIEQIKKKYKSILPKEYKERCSSLASEKINYLGFVKIISQEEFLRFCKGGFYKYNIVEGIREMLSLEELRSIVKIYLENQKPEFVRSKNIEEIISLLQQEAYDKELADRLLLPSENEICLKDGILNIDSMQIRPYSPQDYKFIKLPYSSELMANTQKPTWLLKVLNEVCSHYANPERIIDVIQEFFGYCLLSTTTFHKALMLYGDGGSSKSIVGDVLASLVGEKLTTNVSFAELKEIKQRTLLQHKLVMVSHEMGHNVQLDGEYAKRIIAGESITGYYLYKDTFEFKPCCKVLMATNNLPFVKSIDNSMRRRIILIIFKREKGSKDDPKLFEKIKSELDLVFSWAFQGLLRLLARGEFDLPAEITKDVASMIIGQLDKLVGQLKADYKKGEKIPNAAIDEILSKISVGDKVKQISCKKRKCILSQQGFEYFQNGKTRGYIAPP